ncbi:lysozyme [Asaia bogorensis]|uniref:lysozyme n=1 Tax=Asaia bogorensis TaxID=91915 RepID=UPI0028646700|nr:lysozyme [Asaia bogorensis]MDR6182121.1 lysozyme [Asaia bogorensis NBRC 16594]
MTTSLEVALAFLRRDDIEGLRLAPYLCPSGYWTIGIGNRILPDGSAVRASAKPITEAVAVSLASATLAGLRVTLREAVMVPLTPWQEAALLSWQFNIGSAAMRNSTLVSLLNRGLHVAAGQQLLRWDKATVKDRLIPLPGLQRRRRLELALYSGRPVAGVPSMA